MFSDGGSGGGGGKYRDVRWQSIVMRFVNYLYMSLLISALAGLAVGVIALRSTRANYQTELEMSIEFVASQCQDPHEELRWRRSKLCAANREIMNGPTPTERALINLLRDQMWCVDFDDCKKRYGWLAYSFEALVSRALLVIAVFGVLGIAMLFFGNRSVTVNHTKAMSLPTTCKQTAAATVAACRQTCNDDGGSKMD